MCDYQRRGTAQTTFSAPRFTFVAVSQLEKDTSTALATVREWRNSFIPINRLPVEILVLLPTHLSREKDLLCASSACRHWRRTFIQHPTLWSRVDMTTNRNPLFIRILLQRAKGSALDISSTHLERPDILALFALRTQQLRTLDFVRDCWSNIQRFSEATSGPLPLLDTLKITVNEFGPSAPRIMGPPSPPLFGGAVNLKELSLHSTGLPYLNCFAFPNLTTFELSSTPRYFPASQLLNFLEASPTLQIVQIRLSAGIALGAVSPERIVNLPNVETLSVTQSEPGFRIAAHISSPSIRFTSLVYQQGGRIRMPLEAFPTSVSWNTIGPQHMPNAVDEVTLRTVDPILSCFLSFRSPGPTTLELGYTLAVEPYKEHSQIFSQALEAVQTYPLLGNIKRLRIMSRHKYDPYQDLAPHQLARLVEGTAQLFKFVGRMEELILDVDDLQPFIAPFFYPPGFRVSFGPDVFPQIRGLTIAEREDKLLDAKSVAAIVGFVKSQHTRGIPFERATFLMKFPPLGMAERLEPWVATLNFSEETFL